MATDLLLETPSAPPLRVDAMGPSLLVIGLLCGISDPGESIVARIGDHGRGGTDRSEIA